MALLGLVLGDATSAARCAARCRRARPCRPAARARRAASSDAPSAAAGRRRSWSPGTHQLDREHQALAPHLGDDRCSSADELAEPAEQPAAASRALPCRSWSSRYSRLASAPAVATAGCRRTSRCGWRAAQSMISARPMTPPSVSPLPMPLANVMRSGVDPDAVGLVAPEVVAGAAPAGLHLVGDEEDAVPVEHLLHRAEEPVGRRREPADALDRLGDHAGDVARGLPCRRRRAGRRRRPRCTSSSGRWPNGLRSR